MKTTLSDPTTVAFQLVNATTPGKKAAVTKRMNSLATAAEKEGRNPVMVLAGFKAAATKIRAKISAKKGNAARPVTINGKA